ncbi:uncharacterized protein LOC125682420 isoform X3 [Ostrea edulis]|uniref:uncharacterized protein LOC125682420 isoform X3 n=1 Tax=Ostrea edulis TaxID=37623 RepID=UPI0024AEB584|nr:uncharacterized protein LOC125682420 isoform X3 [Ostrea edulis]
MKTANRTYLKKPLKNVKLCIMNILLKCACHGDEETVPVPVKRLQEIKRNLCKAFPNFHGNSTKVEAIQYDIAVMSERIQNYEKKLKGLEDKNRRQDMELASMKEENDKLKEECEIMKQEIDSKDLEIQEIKSDHSTYTGKYGTLRGDAKKEVQRLRKEMEDLRHKLGHINEEKNYWVRRISEMAGNKMTKGNTQLTDLSDPNRPIKLAERFGELYDACWTNVFEEFMIHHTKGTEVEEKKATDGLKCLLQDCQNACYAVSNQMIKDIKGAIMLHHENITTALDHEINSLVKLASQKNIDKIQEKCKEEVMRKSTSCVKQMTSASVFIDECIDVCWFMVIQNPPLAFYYHDGGEGQEFDKKRFQFYSQSGTKLKYVVWPALLLHKDGNLLRKGIAQPVEEKKKKN